VSLTPVANLPPVSLIPVAICHRCRCVYTGGKFAAGIDNTTETGGKFAAGVVDTDGKFATGVVDTGGNLPPVSLITAAKLLPVSSVVNL
jgi:hypothetical protein